MIGSTTGRSTGQQWRRMRDDDLPCVFDLSREVHPAYPERLEVLASKLALFAPGCLVLESSDRLVGYLFSHPWMRHQPPELDTVLHALPDCPGIYFVHDLSLAESVRGMGHAASALAKVAGHCRALRIPAVELVAVSSAGPFWARHGFNRTDDDSVQRAVRRSYSRDAVHMARSVSS